jgi:competence protein ComEA
MNKKTIFSFLHYTKKERSGIIIVIGLIIVVIAAQYLYPLILKNNTASQKDIDAGLLLLKEKAQDSTKNYYSRNDEDNAEHGYGQYSKKNYNNTFTGSMFYFDPNTLDAAGWQKLGIREKTISTIQNYVSKGGKFRQAEDINKIWGLREDEKQRLIPYVRIAESAKQPGGNYTNNYPQYEKKVYEKKVISAIDINAGDSTAFVSLPGIGAGFSKRIINFRNKLGGFYKIDQVAETFGLPDSVFQKIKPLLKISGDAIKKININTASNEDLKSHPYIRWQLANVITEYKKQHGDYKTLEDLKKIMLINEETYNKISPYLTL